MNDVIICEICGFESKEVKDFIECDCCDSIFCINCGDIFEYICDECLLDELELEDALD